MRKVLYIYISLRQLPPRLVRVLLVYMGLPPKVYRFKVHLLGLGMPYINTDAICKYTLKKRLEIDTRTPLRYLSCEVQT